MCGRDDVKLDAHHITDRSLMPNRGYVLENGITLCDDGTEQSCHLKAELFHITGGENWLSGFHPDDLYARIGSSRIKAEEASLKL
jgi:hypothetical protein